MTRAVTAGVERTSDGTNGVQKRTEKLPYEPILWLHILKRPFWTSDTSNQNYWWWWWRLRWWSVEHSQLFSTFIFNNSCLLLLFQIQTQPLSTIFIQFIQFFIHHVFVWACITLWEWIRCFETYLKQRSSKLFKCLYGACDVILSQPHKIWWWIPKKKSRKCS